MGVTTRADELVDAMRKDIDSALKSTSAAFTGVIIDECWGADEFGDDFKAKLTEAQTTLLELKRKMGERRFFD